MRFIKPILVTLIFCLYSTISFSQNGNDTLLLINGKTIITTVTDIDTINALLSFVKPKNQKKIKTIDSDRIFSITDKEGEHVIYMQDTVGNELSELEMRQFIFGQQDARKVEKGNGGLYLNMLVSLGAGITGSFLSPVVPFLIAGALGLPSAKINEDKVVHSELIYTDAYKLGYLQEAKRKRKVRSLLGGGIGLAVGLGTSVILKAHGDQIFK
jgi:hypothetical protein